MIVIQLILIPLILKISRINCLYFDHEHDDNSNITINCHEFYVNTAETPRSKCSTFNILRFALSH